MKYFSLPCVVSAYKNNANSTTSKFWGVLGILYALKIQVSPGTSYQFKTGVTAQLLEDLFCFGERKEYRSFSTSFYIMFSRFWEQKLTDIMCPSTPNFLDVATWFYRSASFNEEPTVATLIQKFSSDTGLSIQSIENIFSFEPRQIYFSEYKYLENDLKEALATIYGNVKGYSSISAEGNFIKANPGEFSRAPFIQTLYASQACTECLFLTQFPIPDYYTSSPKVKELPIPIDAPLQQIFFGAPGTGKSHTIKEACRKFPHYRITFHPDTDYAAFVGSYKPVTVEEPVFTNIGTAAHPVVDTATGKQLTQKKITYNYVTQPFLKAYIKAWEEQQNENPQPVFLVIEEINRGNCAQIFGDIFQLLDRNESGYSDYPITTDSDLEKVLAKSFANLTIQNEESINGIYDDDVMSKVKGGTHLLLPNNLYIWATMNTSDQSLFPIDSAFKRRWDWKYIKISDSGMNYRIAVNGNEYDWWEFVQAINDKIGEDGTQEDKKLGYFFAKTNRNADGRYIISADRFLSKVLFFLYNDVFKDFGTNDDIFKGENGAPMQFADYFDHHGNTVEPAVERFLQNLDLNPLKANISDDLNGDEAESVNEDDDFIDEEVNFDNKKRASNKTLVITFGDGTKISRKTCKKTLIAFVKHVGIERVWELKIPTQSSSTFISKSTDPGFATWDSRYRKPIAGTDYFINAYYGAEDMVRRLINPIKEGLNLDLDTEIILRDEFDEAAG